MGRKKKKEDDTPPNYFKIRKELKQGVIDYPKMLIELMQVLCGCETKAELSHFITSTSKVFDEDAPEELMQYLQNSIKNKSASMERRREVDITRIKSFSNNIFQ